ncbi:MAG: histidine kinase, partial [Leptospirales bacterium]
LARPDRPLILFIDDLQWADAASLRLLRVLLTATEIRYLLILGAYRDNEVEAEHPLAATIDVLQRREVPIHFLQVGALSPGEVNQLIAASLHADEGRTEPLANFVHQKTGGNPFFVREFLLNLHRSGHIHFDAREGVWMWDAGRISSLPAPDQIGELMAHKIRHLRSETRSALQYAACMGNRFERRLLASRLERPEADVAEYLQPALGEGLVSPLLPGFDDRVKDPESTFEINQSDTYFQFQHDRVQQAAYDSLSANSRRGYHRRIAREWVRLSGDSEEALDENVFSVIHHLDACGDSLLAEPEEERRRLARLYLRGGRRALGSVAYQAAAAALSAGIRILPGAARWDDRDLMRSLYVANAEAEHLCSRNERCIELVETVLERTPAPLDRIPAYEIYLRALNALGQMERLLQVALEALESLGVHLPADPGAGRALFAMIKTQALIRWKGVDSILTAPHLRDENLLAAMRILALFASGAFKTRPNLYAVAMCEYASITYRGGRSAAAAYGLMSMAVILVSVRRFGLADRLSRIALRLLTKDNDHSAKTLFAQVVFVAHWTEALENGFDTFREANRLGVANGDIEYGGYSSLFLSVYRVYSTGSLVAVEPQIAGIYELVRNFRNANVLWATRFFYQLVLKLRDPSGAADSLSGKVFDRESGIERLGELNLQSEIHLYYGAEALLLFLMGEHDRAFVAIQESQRRKKYVRSMYFVPHGDYLEALIRLVVLPDLEAVAARECRKRLAGPLRRIRKLRKINPEVYLHKWHLLRAELSRVDGKHESASLCYNLAIETANGRGYILDEALACERAGEYYASIGNDRIARNYIEDAHRVYTRWGAQAKVRQMEERHSRIFSEAGDSHPPNRETLESTIAFATRSESGDLDIETVTKAVQMLFAGQDASAVMDEFLRLSVENAGAQRGALVLRRGDELWLESARDLNAPGGEFPAQPFESYTALPREIIYYVLHTGQAVVLPDARETGEFTADPYVRRSRCKSILAAPVVYQSIVRGVLYLENRLAASVFTRPRLQILSVLSHQAAVSLENARLYEHMQSEIGEKTRQLLKLKLARDRMDPHFLFNSLNMVQALMRKNPETANRALSVLAELYEMLTDINSAELVEFASEWRFLEEYMNLMQMRYASTLEVTLKRPAELPRFRIPPLTLQPIVENSFKHGFKHSAENMRVQVELIELRDRIQIQFTDNGSDFEREIRPGDTLHSILERLRHYFPEATLNRTGPGVVTVVIYSGTGV